MNRTDRLLAIVLELQAKGWQRAEDLAARFEISTRVGGEAIIGLRFAVFSYKKVHPPFAPRPNQ